MINDIRKKLYDLIVARQAVALSRFHDIRAVTIGDPYTFANSELPAIAIIGEDGQINARGTEYDTQTRTITIILVQSIKDTLGKNDNTRIEWDYRIAEMTEGSVDDMDDCIVGLIRQNFKLLISGDTKTKAVLQGPISWKYTPVIRGEDAYHEARVTFTYSLTSSR